MKWDTFSKFLTNACAGAKHPSHRSFFMPEQFWQEARATSAGFFIFVHQLLPDPPSLRSDSVRHNRNKTDSMS